MLLRENEPSRWKKIIKSRTRGPILLCSTTHRTFNNNLLPLAWVVYKSWKPVFCRSAVRETWKDRKRAGFHVMVPRDIFAAVIVENLLFFETNKAK
jgi:hypothetical protein